MTIPIMLAPPPVVSQTAQTCWACSFESWAEANSQLLGITNTLSSQRLIELFDGNRRLTRSSGRATPDGIMVMASLGFMDLVTYRARRVHAEVLARALDQGYVYLIYFRDGHPAHAVVLYGVDTESVYLMDPMPDRGLITRPRNFLTTLHNGHVVLGLPMLGDIIRGVSGALAPLLSDGH